MQTWTWKVHDKVMVQDWVWCKIGPKTNVEQTRRNEGSYFYLYPFGDLLQISFQGGFYVCKKNSWKPSYLRVNYVIIEIIKS